MHSSLYEDAREHVKNALFARYMRRCSIVLLLAPVCWSTEFSLTRIDLKVPAVVDVMMACASGSYPTSGEPRYGICTLSERHPFAPGMDETRQVRPDQRRIARCHRPQCRIWPDFNEQQRTESTPS